MHKSIHFQTSTSTAITMIHFSWAAGLSDPHIYLFILSANEGEDKQAPTLYLIKQEA